MGCVVQVMLKILSVLGMMHVSYFFSWLGTQEQMTLPLYSQRLSRWGSNGGCRFFRLSGRVPKVAPASEESLDRGFGSPLQALANSQGWGFPDGSLLLRPDGKETNPARFLYVLSLLRKANFHYAQ